MLRIVTSPDVRKRTPASSGAANAKRATQVSFTPPPDIKAKLEEIEARGYPKADGIYMMIRAYMDAQAEIGGELWWQVVEKAASEQRTGVGAILGRLARTTLEAQQRKK